MEANRKKGMVFYWKNQKRMQKEALERYYARKNSK